MNVCVCVVGHLLCLELTEQQDRSLCIPGWIFLWGRFPLDIEEWVWLLATVLPVCTSVFKYKIYPAFQVSTLLSFITFTQILGQLGRWEGTHKCDSLYFYWSQEFGHSIPMSIWYFELLTQWWTCYAGSSAHKIYKKNDAKREHAFSQRYFHSKGAPSSYLQNLFWLEIQG